MFVLLSITFNHFNQRLITILAFPQGTPIYRCIGMIFVDWNSGIFCAIIF